MNEKWAPILTAITAALAPLGVWLFKAWEFRSQRQDRGADRWDKRETTLFERQDRQLASCYARIDELEKELRALERDRDDGWAVAWAWFTRAQEMRHEVLVYQLTDRTEDGQLKRPAVPPLPGFREIVVNVQKVG